jgi:hypothetical protein
VWKDTLYSADYRTQTLQQTSIIPFCFCYVYPIFTIHPLKARYSMQIVTLYKAKLSQFCVPCIPKAVGQDLFLQDLPSLPTEIVKY